MTGAKSMALEVSRLAVKAVLRLSRSTSPDCTAVNLSLAFRLRNSTASGLSNRATATARHTSTSSPEYFPDCSTKLNPGKFPLTPQTSLPRLFILFNRPELDVPPLVSACADFSLERLLQAAIGITRSITANGKKLHLRINVFLTLALTGK